jgi:formylmethanofuran dehydrogenase subunit E
LPGEKAKTTQQFIDEALKIHKPEDYDYSLVKYENAINLVKIICKKCENIFEQLPNNHLNGQGCIQCSHKETADKLRKTKEQFVIDSIKIYGLDKYDYSFVNYINSATKVKIKCNSCGEIFLQKPNNHLQGYVGCKNCQVISKGEEKLKKIFGLLGVEYEPQFTLTIIPNRKYDFYVIIDGQNYVIEYDGIQHFKYTTFFKTSLEDQHIIDIQKTYLAIRSGYKVLRISYKKYKTLEATFKEALEIPKDKDLYLSDPDMYQWLIGGLNYLEYLCNNVYEEEPN